jgi:hypothetical protein
MEYTNISLYPTAPVGRDYAGTTQRSGTLARQVWVIIRVGSARPNTKTIPGNGFLSGNMYTQRVLIRIEEKYQKSHAEYAMELNDRGGYRHLAKQYSLLDIRNPRCTD